MHPFLSVNYKDAFKVQHSLSTLSFRNIPYSLLQHTRISICIVSLIFTYFFLVYVLQWLTSLLSLHCSKKEQFTLLGNRLLFFLPYNQIYFLTVTIYLPITEFSSSPFFFFLNELNVVLMRNIEKEDNVLNLGSSSKCKNESVIWVYGSARRDRGGKMVL